jgi:triacylglycerol esterase/lipase EstA (alpha/beta hydrolase family)
VTAKTEENRPADGAVTFVVSGDDLSGAERRTRSAAAPAEDLWPSAAASLGGTVRQRVRVGATRSAGGGTLRLEARPGQDVVVLHLADGPQLVLHPASAAALLRSQADGAAPLRSGGGGAGAAAGEVLVPPRWAWHGLEAPAVATRGAAQGFLGQVALRLIEVVQLPEAGAPQDAPQPQGTADSLAERVARRLAQRFDGQAMPGLRRLRRDAPPASSAPPAALDGLELAQGPVLVLLHGTFSTTAGTFQHLWTRQAAQLRRLFEHYGDRVLALDHPTLSASPLDNALALVQALPAGARLHLLTHSRGGLVAEALVRASAGPVTADAPAGAQALATALRERNIRIERVVRVACPAHGTLLAGGRLDAYLSVLRWGLELARVPVVPQLVAFLAEVARVRADPRHLPGLEAMRPDSPFLQWLHGAQAAADGDLRVIAGDLDGDSLGAWLKTLATDAFYWTDHDLVVQTRSMYGGVPRRGGAQFLLDRGGSVSHFNYFAQPRTAEAVVHALVEAEPDGFAPIGAASAEGRSAAGLRSAARPAAAVAQADRPAVILLPGLLGSHLAVEGERIWLGWRFVGQFDELALDVPTPRAVRPDGVLGLYEPLIEHLSGTHEVVPFAYDWRRSLRDEARRLGETVREQLELRNGSRQPVRLLAHSMGGLLARVLQIECPAVWDALMQRSGARVLLLGTPNTGSWAPMQCLSGDDGFGNALTLLGSPLRGHRARSMMAGFPGLLQLQAGLLDGAAEGLASAATWARLADADARAAAAGSEWHGAGEAAVPSPVLAWGLPGQPVLDAAADLWKALERQRQQHLPAWADRLAVVVGEARLTPDGFEWQDGRLVYRHRVQAGDGRVTHDSALLPGVPAWRVGADHGGLVTASEHFEAYAELLALGQSSRLDRHVAGAVTRGAGAAAAAVVFGRPGRERPSVALRSGGGVAVLNPLEPISLDDLFAPPPKPSEPLRVCVHNGDLQFVRAPLMLGHYRSNELTGTEKVVDRLIGGTMRQSLSMHQYPDQPGTYQYFDNTRGTAEAIGAVRPKAVIVVGLGAEGNLRYSELVYTVRLGVLALAQRCREEGLDGHDRFELASTLLASGGVGISVGQAAQAICQGVREADDELAELNERTEEAVQAARSSVLPRSWPRVSQLTLVELYHSRASEAWRALQALATVAPADETPALVPGTGRLVLTDQVVAGTGAMRRPLEGGYRGSSYDCLRAEGGSSLRHGALIDYTIDTRKRARAERIQQPVQLNLIRRLIKLASNHKNPDPEIGRTLYQLLLPEEMGSFLNGSSELLLQVDATTAAIPWELLNPDRAADAGNGAEPWAVRAKLVRSLTTTEFRRQPSDASPEDAALVIGEPRTDPGRYLALPAARKEAELVHGLLVKHGLGDSRVTGLFAARPGEPGPDALQVIAALMKRDWRIIHITGHGEPPDDQTTAAPAGVKPSPPAAAGPAPAAPVPGSTPAAAPPPAAATPAPRTVNPRGVVLSDDTFLGPLEIRSMRVVPELVFVNCCYLGARSEDSALAPMYDRARFASTVAEALIDIGVRCVIATGWAVEDDAAQDFAAEFYQQVMRGRRFIDAVSAARRRAWRPGSNTWAAYQAYGDPEWVFQRKGAGAQKAPEPSLDEEYAAVNAAPVLALALETLAIELDHFSLDPAGIAKRTDRIRFLEQRFAPRWGSAGAVAEAFGLAFAAAGDRDRAIHWYEAACTAEDGSASLKAAEQLAHQRVRKAQGMLKPLFLAEPQTLDDGVLQEAEDQLERALQRLSLLVQLERTLERCSLLGSTHKRRFMLARALGRPAAERDACWKAMVAAYLDAWACGQRREARERHYPAMNLLALTVAALPGRLPAAQQAQVPAPEDVRRLLEQRHERDPDFWSQSGLIEWAIYDAALGGRLAKRLPGIRQSLDDLRLRSRSTRRWASMLDQMTFALHGLRAGGTRDAEAAAARELTALLQTFNR